MNHIFWLDLLQAKAGGPAVPGCQGGGMSQFVMLAIMFVIFYFLLIRPQQKRAKEHREMLGNLKRGDEIVTSGGVIGKISGLTDTIVTIEVAEKIRLRVLRTHISGKTSNLNEIEQPSTQQ